MSPVTRKKAQQLQNAKRTVDSSGIETIVKPSATGLGTHTTWVYPDAADVTESSKERSELSAWPTLSSLSSLSSSEASDTPQTPPQRGSWTAGSVVGTPKKLQRSPNRIGGHGINFWRDESGVVTQNIINGAELSRGEVGPSPEVSSGDDKEKTAQIIKKREKELFEFMTGLGRPGGLAREGSMNSDGDLFEGVASGQHFGPEDTIILTDTDSTDGDDSDMDWENENAFFDALQEHQNRQARMLGLEPTIIIRPGQYIPPKPRTPQWTIISEGEGPAPNPLCLRPTEIAF